MYDGNKAQFVSTSSETMGFCVFASILVAFVVPYGQALSEPGENVPKPPVSHDPAYKRAAKMLSNAMNTIYDPCNSFYEYSCDRYVLCFR